MRNITSTEVAHHVCVRHVTGQNTEGKSEIEGDMVSQATGKRFLADCQDISTLNQVQGPPKSVRV